MAKATILIPRKRPKSPGTSFLWYRYRIPKTRAKAPKLKANTLFIVPENPASLANIKRPLKITRRPPMVLNILFFLIPKSQVAYVEEDFTVRQVTEKLQNRGYSAIPILNKEGKYLALF